MRAPLAPPRLSLPRKDEAAAADEERSQRLRRRGAVDDGGIADSRTQMEAVLAANPEPGSIGAVWAAWDQPALGALQAILGKCQVCIDLCPYGAIEFNPRLGLSEVNPSVCKGCGSCSGFCPSGAAGSRHFKSRQIFAEIDGIFNAIEAIG